MARVATCECGLEFETEAPNRRRCYRCSPARLPIGHDPSGGNVLPIRQTPPEPSIPAVPDQPHEPGNHERAVVAFLEGVDKLGTIEGVGALGLAVALDDPWLPGTQRASMLKQMMVMIEQLRAEIPEEEDNTERIKQEIIAKMRGA